MGTWEQESGLSAYAIARSAAIDDVAAAWPTHVLDPSSPEWDDEDGGNTFRDGVRGKTWRELPDPFLRYHHSMMTFLGPAAFGDVLPAWLVCALGDGSNVQDSLLWRLRPSTGERSFHERFDTLTAAQRTAIRHVLEALALRYAGKPSEAEVRQLFETEWSK